MTPAEERFMLAYRLADGPSPPPSEVRLRAGLEQCSIAEGEFLCCFARALDDAELADVLDGEIRALVPNLDEVIAKGGS